MGQKLRMNEQRKRVIAIGEVMIEMARGGDGRFGMGCGGDTFNTAIYLARAGIGVGYATALGDDPYSEGARVARLRRRHRARNLIVRVPGRLPGLTLTDIAPSGNLGLAKIGLWHDTAPARELFELP